MQGTIVAMAAKIPEVILTEYGLFDKLHVLCADDGVRKAGEWNLRTGLCT